ncbi:MAG TPA: methylamine utilization protein, partial [Sphingomicrobium sp.]|nr:methylamine utilization protein [Sphingomicrobium sp.]
MSRPSTGGTFSVSQRDMQFHPFVLVVPVGAKVSFPNLDPTRHHVYSFSPAKKFELKLFAKDQSRSVVFDKPGVVALGCNIHDAMTAFIYVAD